MRREVRVLGLGEARHASGESRRAASDRAQRRRDALDLAVGHLREERQRERARGDVLADRELALAVAEALAVEAHQVDRRQVGLALDAALAQRADDVVAVGPSRGTWTTKTNQPRRSPPASAHGSAEPLDAGQRLAVARRRRARGRRASRRAARAARCRSRRRVAQAVVEARGDRGRASPCRARGPGCARSRCCSFSAASASVTMPPSPVVSCLLA